MARMHFLTGRTGLNAGSIEVRTLSMSLEIAYQKTFEMSSGSEVNETVKTSSSSKRRLMRTSHKPSHKVSAVWCSLGDRR